ncbi:MAG: NnrS family protein [Pseudomonadales bacterium]
MQVIDKRKAMAILPVLRLAFRPFFLLGSVLAIFAALLWMGTFLGGWALPAPLGGWLAWHRHEMVFGFAGAIIAGFLLTAGQTWTGQPSLSGKPLGALVALWLLARLAWWQPSAYILLGINVLFLLAVTFAMARLLWAVRQNRNYPIVAVLLLLITIDVLTLCGVVHSNDAWERQGSLAAVWLVLAMITLIGGRVIPFFTFRGVGKTEQVTAWPWLDWLLLIGAMLASVLTAIGLLLQTPQMAGGLLLLILAVGHSIRIVRWFDAGLLRVPLLWSLYFAYAWLILGCVGLALWQFGMDMPPGQALHALTVGCIGGMILAMVARVSLGHTGRTLELPKGFVIAFILLNVSTLLRVIGTSFFYQTALWLATLAWCLAFLQFIIVYGPMLLKARVDGHPG